MRVPKPPQPETVIFAVAIALLAVLSPTAGLAAGIAATSVLDLYGTPATIVIVASVTVAAILGAYAALGLERHTRGSRRPPIPGLGFACTALFFGFVAIVGPLPVFSPIVRVAISIVSGLLMAIVLAAWAITSLIRARRRK